MKRFALPMLLILLTADLAMAQVVKGPAKSLQKFGLEPELTVLAKRGLGFPGLIMPDKGLGLFYLNLRGTFWRQPEWVAELGLSTEQQRKMDDIFQQYRLKLIDLNAALEKDELILSPLIDALPAGDDAKIAAQIDKIAQDRAELEKANSKMLIGILQVLTPEQWTKLRERKKE